MGGGSSDVTETTNIIRYAPYVEALHQEHIDRVMAVVDDVIGTNPYDSFTDLDFSAAFLGSTALASFPSLYDMYGKFMAGLDVEVLFDEVFEDTVFGSVINDMISTEGVRLSDDIEENIAPRFETGMRDINAVVSSSFATGRAMIEAARVKALSKYSAEVKYRLYPIVLERWKYHLEWNKSVIVVYSEIIKLYISAMIDTSNVNMSMASKGGLWPLNALPHETQAIGAISGATNTSGTVKGALPSEGQQIIGGALTGAGTGAMIGSQIGWMGGPLGAGIGAGVGALLGWLF